jgi:hypothetical protein
VARFHSIEDARRELEIRRAHRAFVERPTQANWEWLVEVVHLRSPAQVERMELRFNRNREELTP